MGNGTRGRGFLARSRLHHCPRTLVWDVYRRTAFNEYQLCVEKRGAEDTLCLQRGRDYTTVCPEKWIENFKDADAKGVSMSVGKAFLS